MRGREIKGSSRGERRHGQEELFLWHPQDVEDWTCLIITFEDGSKVILNAGDCSLGGIQYLLSIFADTCRIHCNVNPNTCIEAYAPDPVLFDSEFIVEKTETKGGWSYPQPDEDYMSGYYHKIEDLVHCVLEDDRQPLSGLDLAIDCNKVIYAAYLAAEKGQRVNL